ncbi:unnamed protein product [Oikopleura dioica]|uniref:Uncharacterized protein n=1 Tax=Oikopleura dioica TaxID=34765 RepID=E4YP26_OIKDI|nr:unnamed protein product [Oikopleura dioica]
MSPSTSSSTLSTPKTSTFSTLFSSQTTVGQNSTELTSALSTAESSLTTNTASTKTIAATPEKSTAISSESTNVASARPTTTTAVSILSSTIALTTTSYETTTVSIVETEGECEFMNELLESSICFLDVRYPLKHCNKRDIGCYKLDGKCVKSIYMDWTLCGNYFNWGECDAEETEQPELLSEWCEEDTTLP